jgi:hypothetical protein
LNHLAGDLNATRPVNAIFMPTPRLKFIFDLMEPERPKVDRAVLSSQHMFTIPPTAFAGLIRKCRAWCGEDIAYLRAGCFLRLDNVTMSARQSGS